MKNILIIVPSLGPGGQEKVAVYTAEVLSEKYNVYLCVFSLSNAVYQTKIKTINLDLPTKSNYIGKAINILKRSRKIKEINKKLKIDVSISFGTTANIASVFGRYINKVIVSVRGYESISKKKFIDKLIYHKADKIICVAKKLATDLGKMYNLPTSKINTIYNAYNVEQIKYLSSKKVDFSLPEPVIVSMGRLENVKGYRHLLKSLKLALNKIHNINLVIIGEGEEKNNLEKFAKQLGIKDYVTFLGFKSNPYNILSKCNIFVMPSIHEGFPNALVEAMACGLPVVAADCKTGPREILQKEYIDKVTDEILYSDYGILVPPFHSDFSNEPEKDFMLAEAITRLLTNRKMYENYSYRSIERAKMFSEKMYKKNMLKSISEII